MENNQDRANLVLELDSEDRCNQILKKAKMKHAKDKKYAYYITPIPQRLHNRYISYSDEEVQAKADDKIKKRNHSSPKTSTAKRPREEPENARPMNAVSTPLPSTSRINLDDVLAKLV